MIKTSLPAKKRFAFGNNWQRFLNVLTEDHIIEAEKSLTGFLNHIDINGKRFLDIGSGSGLHSLVARRLGADVYAFDYDSQSVACTEELKRRYYPEDSHWKIEQGSVLDREYIESLGAFDVSYAWGVLHHTGVLWQALYNAQIPLGPGGFLFIAIYNDQGLISSFWKIIKRTYCTNGLGRVILTGIFYPIFFLSGLAVDILHLRDPRTRYRNHKKYRGMSLLHDWRDWLGGYPYDPAKPEQIISFYKNLGFDLIRFQPTQHSFGNNQFLFCKVEANK